MSAPPRPVVEFDRPAPTAQSPRPPGVRYDHLARTPNRRWYRAPLGFVLLVVLGCMVLPVLVSLGVFLLATTIGLQLDPEGALPPAWSEAETLLAIAAMLPALLIVVWLVEGRRRWGTLSSVTGRLRPGWLALCLLPAVIITVGAVVVGAALQPTTTPLVDWSGFLGVVIVSLLLTPLQAAAEEYVFRGWLVQAFGAFVRTPWPGILVSAALFATMHAGATDSVWGAVDLLVFAIVLSVVTIRTGGLEAAIAMHVVNNSVVSVTSAASGTTESSADYSAYEPTMLALPVLTLVLYGATVMVLARRRGIATRGEPS